MAVSFKHLHVDAHGARHIATDDSGCVLQSLRDRHLADLILQRLLQPDAERANIGLWDAAGIDRIDLRLATQIFGDLVEVRFDAHKLLAAILAILLKDNLIDIVGQHNDIDVRVPERLHVW